MSRSLRTSRTTLALSATALVLVGGLTACGSDASTASDTSDSAGAGSSASATTSQRCAENKAAGDITYMSGYYWQASASILEVIAAEKLGYFDDLCLSVTMQPGPGDTTQNAKLLASGKVQITPLSEQDVITSNVNGMKVTGISSYSNAGLDVLITGTDITDLTQLQGKKLGQKGYLPLSVTAMLDKAGLDPKDTQQVKVGYDPTVLTRGQVDALTGFVSNEPNQLKAAGKNVTVWQPSDFDVPGSLGAMAVNPAFAQKHPTAVQDFLRASFKAYQYCAEASHVDECLGYQHDVAGAQSDVTHETSVWTTETEVAATNPLPGKFGSIDLDNVTKLGDLVASAMAMDVTGEKAAQWFDTSYADAVVGTDGAVEWPAS